MTAPTRRSKAPGLRNAGTAPGARRGEAATGTRRPPVLRLPRCPARSRWSSSWNLLLYQGACIGRKNGGGIVFGHLGNAADSLNAVIYVQCKFPRSESRVHWRTRSVRVSGAILNVGPRVPGPSPQPVSRQTSHVLAPYRGGWHRSPQLPLCLRSVVTVTEERAVLCASSTDACDTVINARCRGCGLTHSLLKALQALLLKLMELV